MEPHRLIGLGYRLGADPVRHGATDCLGLTRTVLAYYGISSPQPERSWYRRLRQGDYSIFPEQLERWGKQVNTPRLAGSVALIRSGESYGLGAWFLDGWLIFGPSKLVIWAPLSLPEVEGIYCPLKPSCATPLRSPETSTCIFVR